MRMCLWDQGEGRILNDENKKKEGNRNKSYSKSEDKEKREVWEKIWIKFGRFLGPVVFRCFQVKILQTFFKIKVIRKAQMYSITDGEGNDLHIFQTKCNLPPTWPFLGIIFESFHNVFPCLLGIKKITCKGLTKIGGPGKSSGGHRYPKM